MSRALTDAPATHFRLSPESLAEIVEAYRNGASAGVLARKWKVSPGTVYRHAALAGCQKKNHGDAIARAHARSVEQREEDDDASMCAYFDADDSLFGSDAALLGERALRASAEAMRRGAFAQGRMFAQMSETYYRIAPNQRDDVMTVAFRVATDESYAAELFCREPEDKCPKKLGYWMFRATERKRRDEEWYERRRLKDRVAELEAALARLSPAS